MSCNDCSELPVLELAVMSELERVPEFNGRVVSLWDDYKQVDYETSVRVSTITSIPIEMNRNPCLELLETRMQFDVRDDCVASARQGALRLRRFLNGKSGVIGVNSDCQCPVTITDAIFAGQRDIRDSANRAGIVSVDFKFRHKI